MLDIGCGLINLHNIGGRIRIWYQNRQFYIGFFTFGVSLMGFNIHNFYPFIREEGMNQFQRILVCFYGQCDMDGNKRF